jgi:hypothetical protein
VKGALTTKKSSRGKGVKNYLLIELCLERFYFPKRQHYLRKSNKMAFDIFEKL